MMLFHSTSYFIHVTLLAITNACPITADLSISSTIQNTLPWLVFYALPLPFLYQPMSELAFKSTIPSSSTTLTLEPPNL